MNTQDLYRNFHANTSPQVKIINKGNFTYKVLVGVLERYVKTGQNILDIGSGAGTLAFYCNDKGNSLVGVDISKEAIDAANKSIKLLNLKNIKFEVKKFPLEVPDGKYDIVICTEVIEHINNDTLAFKKIYTLLRKNGIAIISTPSKNAPLHRLGLAKNFDIRVGHLRRYTEQDLIKLSKTAGFELLEIEKTEGVIRNSLFVLPFLGRFVRFIKSFLVDIVSYIDWISLKLFGESQIFIVVKKP